MTVVMASRKLPQQRILAVWAIILSLLFVAAVSSSRQIAVVEANPVSPAPAPLQTAQSREDRSLIAQEEAAKWAMYSAIAAFLGVVVTSAGLYYIKGTLDNSRAALGEAVRAASASQEAVGAAHAANVINSSALNLEQRAWLQLEIAPHRDLEVMGDTWYTEVLFSVKNIGKTPAIGVVCRAKLDFGRTKRAFHAQWKPDILSDVKIITSGDHLLERSITLFPGQETVVRRPAEISRSHVQEITDEDLFGGTATFSVVAAVLYKTILDSQATAPHVTLIVLGISELDVSGRFSHGFRNENERPLPKDLTVFSHEMNHPGYID